MPSGDLADAISQVLAIAVNRCKLIACFAADVEMLIGVGMVTFEIGVSKHALSVDSMQRPYQGGWVDGGC